jgi:hypothetical protein
MTSTAATILNQIPVSLQMALGVRDLRNLGNGIQFRITGTRTVWVTIKHNAADLYDLKCYTVRSFNETIRFEATDIYADTMVELLDAMDRGQIEL